MIKTEIEFTETRWQELEALAEKRQMPLTVLLQEAVETLLHSAVREDSELRRRAAAAAGRFRSELGDLSTRHDAYLTEDLLLPSPHVISQP